MTRPLATRLLVVAGILAWPQGHARAEDTAEADRLTLEGAKLADAARYDEAIAAFRRAEALVPRAINDCNIGLAHARADRPAHAHFFLRRCRARAPQALPSWVDARMQKLDAALRAGGYAPVEIAVHPEGATVTVAAFLPDDLASVSSPVWLPVGTYDAVVARAGHVPRSQALRVEGAGPHALRVELTAEATEPAASATPAAPAQAVHTFTPPPPRSSLKLAGWITAGAGVALAGGGVYFLLRARDGYDQAQGVIDVHGPWTEEDADALSQAESDDRTGKVLVALGSAALVTGGVLLFLGIRADERARTQVAAAPTDGGAIVGMTCGF